MIIESHINIQEYEISRHIMNDRVDRFVSILCNCGLGEPRYEMPGTRCGTTVVITSTGVALVVNKTSKNILTGYIPTIRQARKLFENDIPWVIYNIINMNQKYIVN